MESNGKLFPQIQYCPVSYIFCRFHDVAGWYLALAHACTCTETPADLQETWDTCSFSHKYGNLRMDDSHYLRNRHRKLFMIWKQGRNGLRLPLIRKWDQYKNSWGTETEDMRKDWETIKEKVISDFAISHVYLMKLPMCFHCYPGTPWYNSHELSASGEQNQMCWQIGFLGNVWVHRKFSRASCSWDTAQIYTSHLLR